MDKIDDVIAYLEEQIDKANNEIGILEEHKAVLYDVLHAIEKQ